MVDFLIVSTRLSERRNPKQTIIEVYPRFVVKPTSDLMIRGGDFYAVWLDETKSWSTNEHDAIQLIDRELDIYYREHKEELEKKADVVKVLHMWDAQTGMIDRWHKFCQKQLRDCYHMLDEELIFANSDPRKEDYSSKKLPYSLEKGDCPAYEKLISTLYSPEERHKIEWAIGSILTGDSKSLQKFMVLYGSAGTGKSTIMNITSSFLMDIIVCSMRKLSGHPTALSLLNILKMVHWWQSSMMVTCPELRITPG